MNPEKLCVSGVFIQIQRSYPGKKPFIFTPAGA